MQLKNIPSGQFVHNIEMIPGKGAQMARSALLAICAPFPGIISML